jgi:hypothetical protein
MTKGNPVGQARVFLLLAVLSACGAQESSPATESSPEATTNVEVPSDRCSPASAALASQIASRLTAEPDVGMPVVGGVTLSPAYIVESDSSEGLYLVGAQILGGGMTNIGAVWATDDPTGHGSILAVSSRASQFSDWPDRNDLEPRVDGFYEADACAHAWLGDD